jgi:hypothetical protein
MTNQEEYKQQALSELAKYLGFSKEDLNCRKCEWDAPVECWLITLYNTPAVIYQVAHYTPNGIWEISEIDLTGLF